MLPQLSVSNKAVATQIIDDAQDLLKNERMSETEQEKANEIIEEARELKKETE